MTTEDTVETAPPPRRKNIALNETPTKGNFVNQQKIVKIVVKGALGLGVSALIGATIKTESKIGDVIDQYFASKTTAE